MVTDTGAEAIPLATTTRLAGPVWIRARNVEPGLDNLRTGRHTAQPVVSLAIDHAASGVGDTNDWEVRVALVVIAVVRALSQAVKLRSADPIILAAMGQGGCNGLNSRSATGTRASSRRVDLNTVREVSEENLARGKNYHVADIRRINRGVWRRRGCVQRGTVPLKNLLPVLKTPGLVSNRALPLGKTAAGPSATSRVPPNFGAAAQVPVATL